MPPRALPTRLPPVLLLALLAAGTAVAQTPDVLWMRGGGGSNDASWAPDGSTFALATEDGTIMVFDGTTRFLVQTIPGNGAPLSKLDYAPDGNRIVAFGEDNVVGVWDRATGEAAWTVTVATDVFGIDVSADGALVAAGHRQGVSLYDAATGALLRTIQTPEEVKDVAFSPDGLYLAASALVPYFLDRQIWLWRTSDWTLARTLTNGSGYPELAFSADGSMLAAAGEFDNFFSIRARLQVWNVATGQLIRTIDISNSAVGAHGPGFSPDGQLVFAGHDYDGVNVYEVDTGVRVSRVPNVEDIRLAPDGQTFLGTPQWCGTRFSWASFSFPQGQLLDDFVTHAGANYNLDVSDDGSMIAIGEGEVARVFDAQSAERLHEFGCSGSSGGNLREVAFSPDASTLAGGALCWDCEITLWDVPTGQETIIPLGHRTFVDGLAFSPDGTQLASGSTYVQSFVVSVPDGLLVHAISTGSVREVAYSRDGGRLAFGEWDGSLDIADAATGAVVRTITGAHAGYVHRVVFSPDRTLLLSSGDDGLVKVWDLATGALVRTMEGHDGPVEALAVSPDGRHVLSGGAGPAKLWDLATGALLHTYTGDTARMMDAEFFPDGATFAFARWDALGVARNPAVQAAVTVSAEPVGGPVVVGPDGGSFQFTVTLTNTTEQPQTVQAWTAVAGPVSREPVLGPLAVTLPAGATVTRTITQQVPGAAPAGTYAYAVNVGAFPGLVSASDGFSVVKEGGALAARGGAPASEADGWSVGGWGEPAASVSADIPTAFALSEAHPNPSSGHARFVLSLPEPGPVTVAAYDALGRRVATLQDGLLGTGSHALVLDGSRLPAGLYVVRATGETFSITRRATLVH